MKEQHGSENETNLASVRKRIAKGGKILNLACKGLKIIAIIGIAVNIVTLFVLILYQVNKVNPCNAVLPKVLWFLGIRENGTGVEMNGVTDAAILKLLSRFGFDAIQPAYREMISVFLRTVMWAAILVIVQLFRKIFGHLEKRGNGIYAGGCQKDPEALLVRAVSYALQHPAGGGCVRSSHAVLLHPGVWRIYSKESR